MNIWAVIPTYNERDNIGDLVARLFPAVPEIRVLVVDDNSPDGTGEVVRSLQTEFPRLDLLSRTTDRGFGRAYLAGFRRVLESPNVDAVLMMDADLSHDPTHIPGMLQKIESCDAVIGSRYAPGGGVAGWELWRRILSRSGNSYVRAVTGMSFRDCTSGFMLIRAKVLRKLDLARVDSTGYAFLMELKYMMWQSGAVVDEAPIWFRDRAGGESKLSGRIVWEGVWAPWKVRVRGRGRRPPGRFPPA